jgi:hypothetical protein
MRKILLLAALTLTASVHAEDYGQPLPADAAPVPLAAALADPAAHGDAPVVVSGRIGKVCQKKGCWITLTDGDAMVRVMTAHKFFLPTDASGNAVVVGTLSEKVFDAEGAAHFTEDAGPGAEALAAGDREWRITATTIRVEQGG